MDNIQILENNIDTLNQGREKIATLSKPYYEKIADGFQLSTREQAYLSELFFVYGQLTKRLNAVTELRDRLLPKPSLIQRIFHR